MIKYILISILIIIILLLPYLNLKFRHKFWFKQPVTHYYNMVILEEGYITQNLPIKPIKIPESYSIVNCAQVEEVAKLFLLIYITVYL